MADAHLGITIGPRIPGVNTWPGTRERRRDVTKALPRCYLLVGRRMGRPRPLLARRCRNSSRGLGHMHVVLAYIDAGSGSLIIQAVIATLVAVPFFLRNKITRAARTIRGWVSREDRTVEQ